MSNPSPVTPDTIKALLPGSNGNACSKFAAALIGIPTKIYNWFKWAIKSDGTFTVDFIRGAIRPGIIVPDGRSSPVNDDNWKVCDGSSYLRSDYPDLYAAIGDIWSTAPWPPPVPNDGLHFVVPDLRDRFPVGALNKYGQGSQGGEEKHTLLITEMPAHDHAEQVLSGGGAISTIPVSTVGQLPLQESGQRTGKTGGDQPHNNIPPYAALIWLIKT